MKQDSLSPALLGLIFLVVLFFLNFTSRVIFSPLLPLIEQEMGIDHAQSGSFFLFISAGYFISILASGFVSARINHKRTIVLSSLALGAALFILGSCTTLLTLQVGLLVLGLGAGLYFPSGLATITHLVPAAYLSRGMSIHELAPNLGFVAAPLLCDFFVEYIAWRQGLAGLGLLIIILGVFYGLSSHGSREKGTAPDLSAAIVFIKMPVFWAMVALFSLAICSTLGIYAMAPLFLVTDHGMDPGQANRLLSLSRIASIPMPLIGGWLGDRFGRRLVMNSVLLITGLLTVAMALVGEGFWLIVLVVAQPLFAVCFYPAGFAVLSKLGSSKYGNLAVSFCLPLAFLIGGGLMPTFIGWIGDIYTISAGILIVGILMVISGLFALFTAMITRKKMIV
ncbi:MAG: MFS transporter [Desulfocapsa sp.]|nr:MFS transporter [Desulfocapsa sp.]